MIPSNAKAYVADTNGAVFPVNLAKPGSVGAPILVTGAYGLAASPDGAYVLAGDGTCCFVTTNVVSIQVSTNTVVATFNTGGFTHRWLAFKP